MPEAERIDSIDGVYDMYSLPTFDRASSARKLRRPAQLPDEEPQSLPQKKVRAKVLVTPFTLIGTVLVAVLLVTVIIGYIRLYEAKSIAGELTDTLSVVQQENTRLRAQRDGIVSYEDIVQYANSHGMQQPTRNQLVYVNIPCADVATVHAPENSTIFEKVWTSLRDSFASVVEYLF